MEFNRISASRKSQTLRNPEIGRHEIVMNYFNRLIGATSREDTAKAAENSTRGQESQDPYLICLEKIAGEYGRSATAEVLTAGLPLENGKLTLELIERAAFRMGLKAKTTKTNIPSLVPIDVPAILVCKDGSPVVLLGKEDPANYIIFLPETRSDRIISTDALEVNYSGTCVRFKPTYQLDDEKTSNATKKSSLSWFWDVAGVYWRNYWMVILATTMINLLALAVPLFVMNAYDRVLPNEAFVTLWVFVAGLMIAFGFDYLLKLARGRLLDRVGRKIDIEIATTLFRKLLGSRLEDQPETSGVSASRFQEYEAVREFLSSNTVIMFVDIAFFAVFAFVIYLIGGWIVVVPLTALVIVVALGFILQAKLTRIIKNAQTESALRHSILVESVGGMETIKSIRAEGFILKRWENFAKAAAESAEEMKRFAAIGLHATGLIQQTVIVLLVVCGAYQFAEGEMTTGGIIAVVMLSNRLIAPLNMIAQSFTRARYVAFALRGLDDFMRKDDELSSGHGFVARKISHGHIEVRKVQFRYPGSDALVFEDLSFTINPGERVGILGRMGSGKTTVGRLITGMYQPTSGEILVDGVDIKQFHPHVLRSAIALVVQDAELFYGTIRENIVMGNPTASDEEIVRAAQLSGADEFIARHPKGFELNVGERGSRLSGGQRQSVALARALILRPKVLFLDEPTSSIDRPSESRFIERLKKALKPEQSLIITTHRNSLLQLVDRLIVLNEGRVFLDGPRNEVVKRLAQIRDQKEGQKDDQKQEERSGTEPDRSPETEIKMRYEA